MPTLAPEIMANIAQRRLGAGQQRTQGLQQYGNQYNQNIQNLDDYKKDMEMRINNQMGSQGLANSTIRMDEQGKMQKTVGQKRGYLDTLYAQQKSGIESGYQSALQAISDYQTQAMQEQGRQDLGQQQDAAQRAFQNQQAAQAQANWQADYNLRAGQGQPAPAQAAGPAGPSQSDIAILMAELQRQADVQKWNEAVWYNEVQRQNAAKPYQGYGNIIGNAGARFT